MRPTVQLESGGTIGLLLGFGGREGGGERSLLTIEASPGV